MSLTAEDLEALAARADPDPDGAPADDLADRRTFQCPDCDAAYTDGTTLRRHRMKVHGWRGPGRPAGSRNRRGPARTQATTRAPVYDDDDPEKIVDIAVGHTRSTAALLFPVIPHLALTVAGNSDPQQGPLVRSRAEVAGELLLQQAKKRPQIIVWLKRYNAFFEGGQAVDVLFSVGAASAVDASALSAAIAGGDPVKAAHDTAQMGVQLGPIALQPIQMAIPDVLEFMAKLEPPPAPEPPASSNGRKRSRKADPVGVVDGGVEGT